MRASVSRVLKLGSLGFEHDNEAGRAKECNRSWLAVLGLSVGACPGEGQRGSAWGCRDDGSKRPLV